MSYKYRIAYLDFRNFLGERVYVFTIKEVEAIGWRENEKITHLHTWVRERV